MTLGKRLLWSFLVLGIVASVIGAGSHARFGMTSGSQTNGISAGTVALSDNDNGGAMMPASDTGLKLGDVRQRCIKVTYDGTLPSDVRMYLTTPAGSLGPHLNVTISKGTQTGGAFPNCSTFVQEGANLVTNKTLNQMVTDHSSYANGLIANPGAVNGNPWTTTDRSLVYRIEVNITSTAAQGLTSSPIGLKWEARNR